MAAYHPKDPHSDRNPAYPAAYEASADLAGLNLSETFHKLVAALWRNGLFLLLITLLFGLIGFFLNESRTPYYQAQASILIDPRVDEGFNTRPTPNVVLADALVVDSEVEILRSEQLLRRVVLRLDLAEGLSANAGTDPTPADATRLRDAIRDLRTLISIEREAQTFIIRIKTRANSAEFAARLANVLAEEYFAFQIENRVARAEAIGDWLQGEIAQMGDEVVSAETRLERYMFENDIPDDNVIGTVEREITSADQALIAARLTLREAEAQIKEIDEVVERARTIGDTASLESQRLLMLALGGREAVRTNQVREELARLREASQSKIAITQNEIRALEARRMELRDRLAQINEEQVQLRKLRRETNALQTQYENLLARLEQAQGEDRFVISNARVIEQAAPAALAANPSSRLIGLAAAMGGLVIGLGWVFLREQLNDTLRSSDDVRMGLNLPYLGPLPRLGWRETRLVAREFNEVAAALKPGQRREIARLSHSAAAPFSRLSETIRRSFFEIRSRRGTGGGSRIIAAISAFSDEGKSFYAANLAFFIARQGARVLLVDGDARNPHLSRSLQPLIPTDTGPEPEIMAEDTLRIAQLLPNLGLMYRRDFEDAQGAEGQIQRLPAMIQHVAERYDYVILDTAPLGYVSDAIHLSPLIDDAILLVHWGKTSTGTLRRILALNSPLADKIAGICLSRASLANIRRFERIPMDETYYQPALRKSRPEADGDA